MGRAAVSWGRTVRRGARAASRRRPSSTPASPSAGLPASRPEYRFVEGVDLILKPVATGRAAGGRWNPVHRGAAGRGRDAARVLGARLAGDPVLRLCRSLGLGLLAPLPPLPPDMPRVRVRPVPEDVVVARLLRAWGLGRGSGFTTEGIRKYLRPCTEPHSHPGPIPRPQASTFNNRSNL